MESVWITSCRVIKHHLALSFHNSLSGSYRQLCCQNKGLKLNQVVCLSQIAGVLPLIAPNDSACKSPFYSNSSVVWLFFLKEKDSCRQLMCYIHFRIGLYVLQDNKKFSKAAWASFLCYVVKVLKFSSQISAALALACISRKLFDSCWAGDETA
jgi:hypothetical protein